MTEETTTEMEVEVATCEDCGEVLWYLVVDDREEVYCEKCDIRTEPPTEETPVKWEQCKECELYLAPWFPWEICPTCLCPEIEPEEEHNE